MQIVFTYSVFKHKYYNTSYRFSLLIRVTFSQVHPSIEFVNFMLTRSWTCRSHAGFRSHLQMIRHAVKWWWWWYCASVQFNHGIWVLDIRSHSDTYSTKYMMCELRQEPLLLESFACSNSLAFYPHFILLNTADIAVMNFDEFCACLRFKHTHKTRATSYKWDILFRKWAYDTHVLQNHTDIRSRGQERYKRFALADPESTTSSRA